VAAAPATQQAPVVVVRSAEVDHVAEEDHSVAEAHVEVVHSLTAVVHSLTVVAHVEVVHSLMVEVHTVVVAPTGVMVVWEVAAKLKVPAHAPQHSSYAAPRS
jgi:hypothetical protein